MRCLTVRGATLDGVVVSLRAVDGIIVALGPEVVPAPGDEVLDGDGRIILPGLVNGHTHAAMTLMRGYGSDLALMPWLRDKIWPAEARLTDDAVYWGTRLACCEMIRTGTTRFWDMYWRPHAVAAAVVDAGLRATVGLPLIDGLDARRGLDLRIEARRVLDELAPFAPMVQASLAPHGIYTVSEQTLAWVAEEAAERRIPIQIHFLEVADEVTGQLERTGERPGAYLDRVGILGPSTVLAHGVWVEAAELEVLAARGATLVTNPASNCKLAVGRVFPYAEVRAAGIAVGIGTDGAASNNGVDLFQDVKLFALLQKHAAGDPAAVPAEEAWSVVTGRLAPVLGATSLAVGAPADFLLVSSSAPELMPGYLVANLVYAASGSVVETTVVAGRVLMRDRIIDDEAEVVERARSAATELGVLAEEGAPEPV